MCNEMIMNTLCSYEAKVLQSNKFFVHDEVHGWECETGASVAVCVDAQGDDEQ